MTVLECEIRELIASEGPIPVDRYMSLALGHPLHGYYMNRDPLGAGGDFTTAPEISQMFGELIGLWTAEVWTRMGRPQTFRLVEFGPGRGTLMADAVRASRVMPGFREAARIHLVETSPILQAAQSRTLAGADPVWHASLDEVPDGPAIVLANEFLDALPIRQFVRGEGGWHERLVGLAPDGGLMFGLATEPDPAQTRPGRSGETREVGEVAVATVASVTRRLAGQGGAALLIDYGHVRSAPGETLQAVRGHAFVDPLADPGEADLTAHVDFEVLARVAARAGAAVHGPVTQGAFLEALGIAARVDTLGRRASAAQGAAIEAARERLTGPGPAGMGALFKAIGLSHPSLGVLPGFPAATPARIGPDTSRLEPAC